MYFFHRHRTLQNRRAIYSAMLQLPQLRQISWLLQLATPSADKSEDNSHHNQGDNKLVLRHPSSKSPQRAEVKAQYFLIGGVQVENPGFFRLGLREEALDGISRLGSKEEEVSAGIQAWAAEEMENWTSRIETTTKWIRKYHTSHILMVFDHNLTTFSLEYVKDVETNYLSSMPRRVIIDSVQSVQYPGSLATTRTSQRIAKLPIVHQSSHNEDTEFFDRFEQMNTNSSSVREQPTPLDHQRLQQRRQRRRRNYQRAPRNKQKTRSRLNSQKQIESPIKLVTK